MNELPPPNFEIVEYIINGKKVESPKYLAGFDVTKDYGGRQYASYNSGISVNDAIADYAAKHQTLAITHPELYNLQYSRVYEAAQMAVMTLEQRAEWDLSQSNIFTGF